MDFTIGLHNSPKNILMRVLFLAVLCLGIWGISCGLWDLWGADEGRYVQIAKEILARGQGWLLLTVHGVPYHAKPPLPFWIIASMLHLNGGMVSSVAVRMPAVIFATLTVLLTYRAGARIISERAGFIAAFIVITSPFFFAYAMKARLDMMYTGWTVIGFFPWLTHRGTKSLSPGNTLLMWLGLTGAFFTKGPLVLFIVFLVVGFEAWREHSSTPVRIIRPLIGFSCLALLIFLWLWAQSRNVSGKFVKIQISEQIVNRILSGSHIEPFWYYFPLLFTGIFFPWIFPFISGLVHLWKKRRESGETLRTLRPLLAWFFFTLIFLSLVPGKRQTYIMPALPAMALLTGWHLDKVLKSPGTQARLSSIITGLQVILVFLLLIAAGVLIAASPSFWSARFENNVDPEALLRLMSVRFWVAALFSAAALITGAISWRFRSRSSNSSILVSTIATLLVLLTTVTIGRNVVLNVRESSRDFSYKVERLLDEKAPPNKARVIGAVGKAQKEIYHVYGTYTVIPLRLDGRIFDKAEKLPSLIAVLEKEWDVVTSGARKAHYEIIYKAHPSSDSMFILERIVVP